MEKYRKFIISCLLLFSLLFIESVYAEEESETGNVSEGSSKVIECIGILASVNGSPITLIDILKICGQEESRLPYMFQGEKLDEEIEKLRLEALYAVINNKLIYGDFERMKFKLPISYMQTYLDKIAESYNLTDQKSLKDMLESRGQNYDEFKKEAYKNAAIQALVNDQCYRNVNITPEDVYNYYENNKDDFITPVQIEVQILKLKRRGTHKNELDTLADTLAGTFKERDKQIFNDAVLMYSEGPEVQKGGNIGWIEKEKLRKDFAEAVSEAEVGDIVGPIKAEDAYYFIRVADKKSQVVKTFKDAKESIKDKLVAEAKKNGYKNFIDSLKAKASIKFFVNQ